MKFFVISNMPEKAEKFVDMLSSYNAGVVLKEVDTDNLGDEVIRATNKADSIILVVKDPVKVTIDLNKINGVTAAQCTTGSDIAAARKNGVNVIIMGDGADLEDFAESLIELGKQELGFAQFSKKRAIQIQQKPATKQQASAKKEIKIMEEEAEEDEEAEGAEDDYENEKVEGGFFKKIKHAFGIVEEK